MKILYLYQYFVAREGHGITRAYEFARRLQAMGHEVTVVTSPGYLPERYKALTKTTRVDIEGVSALVIPAPYSQTMSFPRRIRAFLQFALLASWACMRTPADLVYASSGPLTIIFPALAAKLMQRIPMIFEVRDLWPELPIAMGLLRSPLSQWAARAMEWIGYHAAAHVVALSPGMAEGVMRRGIPAERITVIPNSCDVDLFDVPAETGAPIRDRLGLAPAQPLIVYTGAFGMANNLCYLVDIAAEMKAIAPDVHFLMIGTGAQEAQILDHARTRGVLDQTLSVWKPLPKTEMPAVLAAATVNTSILMPIKEMWSSSSNKFFDSLAAGRPVAINYGGWKEELIRRTQVGIRIPDQDARLAAQQLAAFVQDEARLQVARKAARELAATEFDRDKMAERMESLMRKVAGAA